VLEGQLTVVDDPATGERWINDTATGEWYIVDFVRLNELRQEGRLDMLPPVEQALVGYMVTVSEFA
jgi:hypothetical protein